MCERFTITGMGDTAVRVYEISL